MHEQPPTQLSFEQPNQLPPLVTPHRRLVAGCCLFALMMSWMGSGRAAEPRLPLSAAAPVLTSQAAELPAAPAEQGAVTLTGPQPAVAALPVPVLSQAVASPDMTMDIFLDRLMRAESGGRLTARSSTSTAFGPFQFIDATFLIVVRRHFAAETATLTPSQILALRSDLAFSRRAAEAFTKDNAALLVGAGIPATFQNLRLAYLLGPGGAIKVLQTDPAMPLPKLLSSAVMRANPFMRPLTVSGLVARAAREVTVAPASMAGIVAKPAAPADVAAAVAANTSGNIPANVPATAEGGTTALNAKVAALAPRAVAPPTITVTCDLGLASCRKWLAMEQRRQGRNRTAVREARLR
jgi:hypothetical protein